MAANKDYFDKIKNSIKKITKWDGTEKEAFGYFDSSECLQKSNNLNLYEFWCLVKVLEDLSHEYKIKVAAAATGKYCFPKSPGNKNNFAYFRLLDKTTEKEVFHFCYGTNIKLSWAEETSFAPDISIQRPNDPNEKHMDPNEKHVDLIMDAKYRSHKTKKNDSSNPDPDSSSEDSVSYNRLDVSVLRGFAEWIRSLETEEAASSEIIFKEKYFKNNCILTNISVPQKHSKYCCKRKMKLIGKFDVDVEDIDILQVP